MAATAAAADSHEASRLSEELQAQLSQAHAQGSDHVCALLARKAWSGQAQQLRTLLECPQLAADRDELLLRPAATGHTPLMAAAANGHADVVEVLLRYNADAQVVCQAAAERKSAECEAAEDEQPAAKDETHSSSAVSGAEAGDEARGEAPEGAPPAGATPLLLAAEAGHGHVMLLLLRHRPAEQLSLFQRDEDGEEQSALLVAARAGSDHVVHLLLDTLKALDDPELMESQLLHIWLGETPFCRAYKNGFRGGAAQLRELMPDLEEQQLTHREQRLAKGRSLASRLDHCCVGAFLYAIAEAAEAIASQDGISPDLKQERLERLLCGWDEDPNVMETPLLAAASVFHWDLTDELLRFIPLQQLQASQRIGTNVFRVITGGYGDWDFHILNTLEVLLAHFPLAVGQVDEPESDVDGAQPTQPDDSVLVVIRHAGRVVYHRQSAQTSPVMDRSISRIDFVECSRAFNPGRSALSAAMAYGVLRAMPGLLTSAKYLPHVEAVEAALGFCVYAEGDEGDEAQEQLLCRGHLETALRAQKYICGQFLSGGASEWSKLEREFRDHVTAAMRRAVLQPSVRAALQFPLLMCLFSSSGDVPGAEQAGSQRRLPFQPLDALTAADARILGQRLVRQHLRDFMRSCRPDYLKAAKKAEVLDVLRAVMRLVHTPGALTNVTNELALLLVRRWREGSLHCQGSRTRTNKHNVAATSRFVRQCAVS